MFVEPTKSLDINKNRYYFSNRLEITRNYNRRSNKTYWSNALIKRNWWNFKKPITHFLCCTGVNDNGCARFYGAMQGNYSFYVTFIFIKKNLVTFRDILSYTIGVNIITMILIPNVFVIRRTGIDFWFLNSFIITKKSSNNCFCVFHHFPRLY